MSSLSANDRRWLDAAVRIAMPYRGTTAENPSVGALVVDEASQVLLGRGVTASGGRPHAETQALDMAGSRARGATLYVTLEPCNHWGKTPPCSDAVIDAGIVRVVIGQIDPDPRTAGASISRLLERHVAVVLAEHGPSARLHEGFLTRLRLGRPFVICKLAVSADGMIGRADRGNVAITGAIARTWTHMQRALSDAVMVGSATARLDDPQLSVRIKGLEHRRPRALIVAGRGALPTNLRLFSPGRGASAAVVGVTGTAAPEGVEVWPAGGGDYPDVRSMLSVIAERGISRVLTEGGAKLTGRLLDAGVVDRFHLLTSRVEIGADGIPAMASGSLAERLLRDGLQEVDRVALGDDMLRTFERALPPCSPAS